MPSQPMGGGSGMPSSMHIGKQGSSSSAMASQSRLKKNSAIDRASASVTGATGSKHGHGLGNAGKVGSKISADSSKHMMQQRELSQQYLADAK